MYVCMYPDCARIYLLLFLNALVVLADTTQSDRLFRACYNQHHTRKAKLSRTSHFTQDLSLKSRIVSSSYILRES